MQLGHSRPAIKDDHAIITALQGGSSLITVLTPPDPVLVPELVLHEDHHSLRQAWTEVNDWEYFWRNLQSCVATTTNILDPSSLISDVVVLLGYGAL
jgi:hypothetical protein